MHSCPHCGQACDCSGDIDDCEVMTEEWVFMNRTCCDDEFAEDFSDPDDDDYFEP
jgi:hypothetical protein